MNITRGKIAKAQKVVIYGPEGIGKSTLASKFPEPLFSDTEGSTNNMDVARVDKATSWAMLQAQIDWIKQTKPCKTFIIDTADWAERLAIDYVTTSANKTSITQFGYGEGFIQLEETFGKFLNKLSDLTEIGINVVLNAHAKIVKFEQPDELGAYDRWELKLGNKTTAKTASLVKEWADMVLFCNYKTYSVATDDKGKKHKGQGGKRVIYTDHHPAWDAKNRFDLPSEIDMDFAAIAHIFKATEESVIRNQQMTQTQSTINIAANDRASVSSQDMSYSEDFNFFPKSLQDLLYADQVTTQELSNYITVTKGHFPLNTPLQNLPTDYTQGALVANWSKIIEEIKLTRKLPF